MSDANPCRSTLRAQLISLSEFVRRHSLAVLGGRASVAPLIDINTAIMKGLRGDVEARGMSGLVLKLGPHERIMINGVVMENGDRRARLNVLTPEANVLRLRDAIHPDEVNTPVRRVCYIAQLVLAGEADPEEASRQLAARHRAAEPGVPGRRQPRRISPPPPRRWHERRFYQAMRALRNLLPREARLLGLRPAS